MTDDKNTQTGGNGGQDGSDDGSQDDHKTTAGSKNTEHMIPKSRLDEALQRTKDLEADIKARDEAAKLAEEKRLQEQENYKELYEQQKSDNLELKPKADAAEDYEKTLKSVLDAQIETIPESLRSLVPEALTTKQKLDWIADNKELLSKSKAFDIGAGHKGGSGSGNDKAKVTEEIQRGADLFGLTKEQAEGAAKRKAAKSQE